MNNNFNLKQFLAEGKLLSENTLENDIKNFIDSIEIDNYQRSKDNDPDYEEANFDLEFFLDMYPEYEGKEEEIQQILNNKGLSERTLLGKDRYMQDLERYTNMITSQIKKTTNDMENGKIQADSIQYLEKIIEFCEEQLKIVDPN
jgi:uncharacterized protein (DUF885 family)